MDIDQNLIQCIFEKNSKVKLIRKCSQDTLLAFCEYISVLSIQLENNMKKNSRIFVSLMFEAICLLKDSTGYPLRVP